MKIEIKSILDVISYLMDEKTLSEKEIYTYDINKNGVVDKEDLISLWEIYAKDTSQIKFYTDVSMFNKSIRKLLTSDIYSETEVEDITIRMSNISTQHITITFNSPKSPMFQTKRGAKKLAKGAKFN